MNYEQGLVKKYAKRRLKYLGRKGGADNPSAAEQQLWRTVLWTLGDGELPIANPALSTPVESLARQLIHSTDKLYAAKDYPMSSSDTTDLYVDAVVACALAVRVLRRLDPADERSAVPVRD